MFMIMEFGNMLQENFIIKKAMKVKLSIKVLIDMNPCHFEHLWLDVSIVIVLVYQRKTFMETKYRFYYAINGVLLNGTYMV